MNKLFLFTTSYPYGYSETFIDTEIYFLSKHFNKIIIVPSAHSTYPQIRSTPGNVDHTEPLINCRLDQKLRLLTLGIFNCSPIIYTLKEFFFKKVFKYRQWMLNWLSYTCIVRASLSSPKFKQILNHISENDLLYFYWADNTANLVPVLKKKIKNKMVVRFHGGDLYEERKGNYLPYKTSLLKSLDLAVFISKHGKNYIEKRYPCIMKKAIVSRLGVKDNGISKPSTGDTLTIVSCSSITEVKRIHLIPMALKHLDFKIHWMHFGVGPLINNIHSLTNNLPAHISVSLKGRVNNKNILNFYRDKPVDVFINVSESEGLPVSIMEAVSMGIPVIATDTGGVSEIVSNENGYLMPNNPADEEIAGYIKEFCLRKDKNILRANSRKIWEENFNAENNYNEFCKILQKI